MSTINLEGADARYVRTGAVQTYVHDVGQGAPVLLIHGSGPGVSA